MTYPDSIPPNIQNDINKIGTDIGKRGDAITHRNNVWANLEGPVLGHLDSIKDAMLAMAYVVYVFESLSNNQDQGSILGYLDGNIGILGANLSVSGDTNLVQSDYQGVMNQGMNEGYDPTKGPGPDTDNVKVFARVIDAEIAAVNNPNNGIPDNEKQNILGKLCEIRRQIHVTFDDGSKDTMIDPTSISATNPNGSTFEAETNTTSSTYSTVYIDTDGTTGGTGPADNKIHGFNQLNYNAQQQGDKSGAATVIQTTDNDNNTIKTSLGSVSQVVQSDLSHATNVQKEIMGVFDNILHSLFKAMDLGVQNQKSN